MVPAPQPRFLRANPHQETPGFQPAVKAALLPVGSLSEGVGYGVSGGA
jgi:hypothetical protein